MTQYQPLKKRINEKDLNRKIELLADMVADALMKDARTRVLRRMQGRSLPPEAA
jgi:hypothetical protein